MCSGCGLPLAQTMDGDLLDEWGTLGAPHRCGGCTAIDAAAEKARDTYDHPGALRYIVGLNQGWQDRKAALVAARAAKDAAAAEPYDE